MAPVKSTLEWQEANHDGDVSMEKDETEDELEKLVFGDDVGFQEGLKLHGQSSDVLKTKSKDPGRRKSNKDTEEDIEGVDDSDVR